MKEVNGTKGDRVGRTRGGGERKRGGMEEGEGRERSGGLKGRGGIFLFA